MSIDTLANVKTRLGVTGTADDSLLTLFLDRADAFIGSFTGRNFLGGSFTEYHPAAGEFALLANYPLAAVTSVKVDSTGAFAPESTLTASAYIVHAERGVVQSRGGAFLRAARLHGLVNADLSDWRRDLRAVQIVYATATDAVPADVREAYAQIVGHWYRAAKTQLAAGFVNLTQQKYGDTFTSFSINQVNGLPLPPDVRQLLAPYRTPSL